MAQQKLLLKVVILGDSNVGKTSLMNQFVSKKFSRIHKATIGADFLIKEFEADDYLITMQIWDTAGQERFQSLGAQFYRGADACMFVFDLTNGKSLESLITWREEFLAHSNPQDGDDFPCIVMGNKYDLFDEREVTNRQMAEVCHRMKVDSLEVSAKDGTNVEEAFQQVARKVIKRAHQSKRELDYSRKFSVLAHDENETEKKKCCKNN